MTVETLNTWGDAWADFMLTALLDGTLLLGVASILWLVLHRRASAQLGYLLFLLVITRLALPLAVPVPASLAWLSPREAGARLWQRFNAKPAAHRTHREAAWPPETVSAADLEAHRDLLPRPSASAAAPASGTPRLSTNAWLMLGCTAMVAALLTRFGWVQCSTMRRFRHAQPITAEKLGVDATALGRRLGLRRAAPLATSAAVGSPVVWGLWRPRLILPPGMTDRLPRDQLAWVLAHELAHVRRGDLWFALVQRLVQIVYCFHPAVWLANWQIDRLREFACDDAALAAAKSSGHDCASALVSIAEWASGASPRPALGLFHSETLLRRRVMRLINERPGAPRRLSVLSVVLLGIAALLVLPHVRAENEPTTKDGQPAVTQAAAKSGAAANPKPHHSGNVQTKSKEADEGGGPEEAADHLPPLEQRRAALKVINAARGNVWPAIERLLAAGVTHDFHDPRYRCLGADLSRVAITDDILRALAAFPELERLSLSESGITDDKLAKLPLHNLKYLDLNDTPVSDRGIDQLWPLKRLESLELARTAVTGAGLATLATLRNLQAVTLDETAVNDAGMVYLAKLPKLAILSLNKTAVGDAALEQLRNTTALQHLDLRGTQVSDTGLRSLQGLAKLHTLQLDDTRVSDDGIEAIGRLPDIHVLTLGNTSITDASVATIVRQVNLESLSLSRTKVTELGVKRLREIRKLVSLDLSGTKITDAALQGLANMDKLESLKLADTPITDAGLAYLKPLLSLRQLNLSRTRISHPPLETLKDLPRLTSVDVRQTEVSRLDVFRAMPLTSPSVQKIVAALAEMTDLDFENQPLAEVIEYLKQRHDIEMQWDAESLDDAGVDIFRTSITLRRSGIRLREALEAILNPLGLTMAVRHEVLLIAARPLPEEFSDFPVAPAGQRLSPKVAEALMKRCDVAFRERPFHGAINDLAQQCGLEIELDAPSLAKAGIPLDCPVTKSMKGVTLKSFLELELDDLHLTCVAEGEKVVIRTKADQ